MTSTSEISRLHGLLTEDGWDEGLFRQLLVFQEEREGLGNTIRASNHRFDDEGELSISAQDGPEELRQKIEYAQDRVAYYQERQREIAYRFGVNLVMHVLTGNYKSDQVHVPALLDRLGQ